MSLPFKDEDLLTEHYVAQSDQTDKQVFLSGLTIDLQTASFIAYKSVPGIDHETADGTQDNFSVLLKKIR